MKYVVKVCSISAQKQAKANHQNKIKQTLSNKGNNFSRT